MTGNPRIEVIDRLDRLDSLSPALEELARSNRRARAFDRPGFLLPLARAAATEGRKPMCLAAWRGRDLCGFAPIFARRSVRALFGCRLGPPRFGETPQFSLLTAPADASDENAGALARYLRQLPWIEQRFPLESTDSVFASAWAESFATPGFSVRRAPGPKLHIAGGAKSGDDYLRMLSGKARNRVRRYRRRLEEGGGEIEMLTGPIDVEPCIDDIGKIVRRSWKATARMQSVGMRLLAGQICNLVPDGTMRLWFVRVGNRRVAVNVELKDGAGRRSGYFTAQDPAANRLYPGLNLVVTIVRQAFDEGARQIDYWNARNYVKPLATGQRETITLAITRTDAVSRLRLAAWRRLRRTGTRESDAST